MIPPARITATIIVVLMFVIVGNNARARRPDAHDLNPDHDRTATATVAVIALALALVEGWPYALPT